MMPSSYAPAPEKVIEPFIRTYFNLGFGDKSISEHLKDHYDTNLYSIG